MKRIAGIMCAAAVAFSGIAPVLPEGMTVFAKEEKPISGKLDEKSDFTWKFDAKTGTLTINGTGMMPEPNVWDGGTIEPWEYQNHYWNDITKIVFSKSVTGISTAAFYHLDGLKSIEIPDQITKIGSLAFQSCSALEEVKLPDTLTSVEWNAFDGTPFLKKLLETPDENGLVIYSGVLLDGKQASGTVTVPANVRVVADNAFSDFFMIYNSETGVPVEKVVFEEGVEYIGKALFYTANIKEVDIPASVKRIDAAADDNNNGTEYGMFPHWPDSQRLEVPAFQKNTDHIVTIRSKDCEIADFSNTLGYTFQGDYKYLETLKKNPDFTDADLLKMLGDYSHITIRAYKGSTAEAYANQYGYTFESLDDASPAKETPTGDFDGDGEITASDAQNLLAAYAEILAGGQSSLTEEQKKACDIDKDGEITAADAQYILIYYTENTVAGNPVSWDDIVK